MNFKFEMDATVRTRHGVEGKVTARIERTSGPHYRLKGIDCQEYEEAEKSLWRVSCVPRWLTCGAEIQWLGTGDHLVYVVTDLQGGGRYHPWSFTAQRGIMRIHSDCTPADMKFWRPVAAMKEPRPGEKR
jgi:hypothetical protein